MCIIAVKPKGVALPSKEILRRIFTANPDGAGVAYNLGGVVKIIKGLMTYEDFEREAQKIPATSTAILHTRIQTHGGICKELTHPFILDADIKKQRQLRHTIKHGEAVAHNGVFSEFNARALHSDTTQFITNYLAPLKAAKEAGGGRILDEDIKPIINRLVGYTSRLAILNERGEYCLYGSGWEEAEGVYYSNSSYKPPIIYHWTANDWQSKDGGEWHAKKSEGGKKHAQQTLFKDYDDYICKTAQKANQKAQASADAGRYGTDPYNMTDAEILAEAAKDRLLDADLKKYTNYGLTLQEAYHYWLYGWLG